MVTWKGTLRILVAVGIVTATTAAWAFSRNLSGSWTTPSGKTFVVLHNTSTSGAVFTTPVSSPGLPVTSVEYKGMVGGADGSTEFKFVGSAEDIAVRDTTKGVTCTFSSLTLLAEGQVLGQFPQRSLLMKQCFRGGTTRCVKDDGTVVKDDLFGKECSGVWK